MAVDLFVVEMWTYLAICIVVGFGRVIARWKTQTFAGLKVDDFLMLLVVVLYAAETFVAYIVGAWWHGLANSGLTPEERAAIDVNSEEYKLRIHGSKSHLSGWLIYTVLLWAIKACWLFFYKRLGDGVDNMATQIKIGFVFCGTTFIATILVILCGCLPIYKRWQINPDPGNACQLAISKLTAWTLICTNLSTDLYIMTIPLPMVFRARISSMEKLGLAAMFCGGLITAIFGGLRCGFILKGGSIDTAVTAKWSHRETFVAIIISNLPILVPMLRRTIRRARNAASGDRSRSGNSSKRSDPHVQTFGLSSLSSKGKGCCKKKFKHPLSLPGETFYQECGSEEQIIGDGNSTKTEVSAPVT